MKQLTKVLKTNGVLVYILKAGCDKINNSNTSRRFFENPECAFQIIGNHLIQSFQAILTLTSGGHDIGPKSMITLIYLPKRSLNCIVTYCSQNTDAMVRELLKGLLLTYDYDVNCNRIKQLK